MEDKKVILNEQEYSYSEFLEKKKEIESKPGVRIVEVKPGVYRTKIQG